MLGRTRRIHFVGIGGSGMNGIAELLANLGYEVSGSDVHRSDVTDRLARHGIEVHEGHDARHVGDADVVVVSAAVRKDNPEIAEAGRRKIPVIPRAEMLAELMRLRYGIAVAGAHGKTTTTSMIALVLERAGLDPTAVIGGRLSAFGGHARLGRGDLMVVEADESDRSFLRLSPALAVITNIDHEHLENYRDFAQLKSAFADFANKVPFYGATVACTSSAPVREILQMMTRRVITYALDRADADIAGREVRVAGLATSCQVVRRTAPGAEAIPLGEIRLRVPGRHNLENALAAVAVALEVGVDFGRIASALEEFAGVERRFERRGEAAGVLVVDDYGHHPTEIEAVLAAARSGLGRRIVVVFQPHRYTRTAALLGHFGPALAGADELVLTDIYAAGEEPIAGVTLEAFAAEIARTRTAPLHVVPRLSDVPETVARVARPGDVVITLGAGSVGGAAAGILEALERRGMQATGTEEEPPCR